jgi:hypothetical protein
MDKQTPWYKNVRLKLIAFEKLSDILFFKRAGQFTVIVFNDLTSKLLAT